MDKINIELLLPMLLALLAAWLTIKISWNWRGDKYLCDNCRFNNDEDCKKADRPQAIVCLSYRKTN